MSDSPTKRSKAMLLAFGWTVAITEKWNPFAKVRQDLFGFIDILAMRGNELIAIQTTSGSNVSARLSKIKGLEAARLWVSSPSRKLIIHGWRKVGARGKRKQWECREEIVTEQNFL